MASQRKHLPPEPATSDAIEDYTRNMFRDGHNRAEHTRAPAYDRAAHRGEAPLEAGIAESGAVDTAYSRDGTGAAGLYDESGGPIGGTEAELDALESGATPVDRNPRMQE